MNPRVLRVIQWAYFPNLAHTKQLLLVQFCDNTAIIGAEFKCDTHTYGRIDRHEILIKIIKWQKAKQDGDF